MIHAQFEADFYFIRHGESESNATPGLAAGVNFDAPMTERGRRQARALGERLRVSGVTFDRIYSSTLQRAVQTTTEMLRGMGSDGAGFVQAAEIMERQVPAWRGQPIARVFTPDVLLQVAEAGRWFQPGDGESDRTVERRFAGWLDDELLHDPDFVGRPGVQRVAVISHGRALQCLFHHILGFDDRFIGRIGLLNTSISRFRFDARGWWPVSINDAGHTREIGDVVRESGEMSSL